MRLNLHGPSRGLMLVAHSAARQRPHPCAKDTGLTNLPLHDFAQNQIWCALIALAADLTA